MQFHPRALLFSAVFLALLWLAWALRFGLLTIAFEVLFGWGLGLLIPEEWPRPASHDATAARASRTSRP